MPEKFTFEEYDTALKVLREFVASGTEELTLRGMFIWLNEKILEPISGPDDPASPDRA